MMKLVSFYFFTVLTALMAASCGGRQEEPRKITAVSYAVAEPYFGAVSLSWINPRNSQLSYISVSWGGAGGERREVKVTDWNGDPSTGVSEGKVSIPMDDLDEHEFSLVAVTRHGIESRPVKVSSHALDTPEAVLLGSVRLSPDFGCIRIGWAYPYNEPITLKVEYSAGGGAAATVEFDAVAMDEAVIENLTPDVPVTLTMNAVTKEGPSEPVVVTRTPFAPEGVSELSKNGWSIASVSDEQPGGNFTASHAVDGDPVTYWHTQTNPEPISYPHWMVVDMNAERAVSRISVLRDPASATAGKPAEYIVSVSGDGLTWKQAGRFAFNPDADGRQTDELGRVWTARYFKFELTRDSADFTYTYINEVTAYGFETIK